MTEVEIIEELKKLVESSKEFGGGWSPDSASYAGLFFSHFREARDRGYLTAGSPLLTGDAMTDFIRDSLKDGEDG